MTYEDQLKAIVADFREQYLEGNASGTKVFNLSSKSPHYKFFAEELQFQSSIEFETAFDYVAIWKMSVQKSGFIIKASVTRMERFAAAVDHIVQKYEESGLSSGSFVFLMDGRLGSTLYERFLRSEEEAVFDVNIKGVKSVKISKMGTSVRVEVNPLEWMKEKDYQVVTNATDANRLLEESAEIYPSSDGLLEDFPSITNEGIRCAIVRYPVLKFLGKKDIPANVWSEIVDHLHKTVGGSCEWCQKPIPTAEKFCGSSCEQEHKAESSEGRGWGLMEGKY